jgi:RNA recognition motif-containing protein
MSYSTTDASLKDLFSQAGNVSSATIIMDKMTGRSKGFGFVEFADDAEADAAIEKFNGMEVEGRKLTVNEARPMEPRAPRTGGNGGGYGNDRGGDRGGRSW